MEFKTPNNPIQNPNPEKKKFNIEDLDVFRNKLMAARKLTGKSCRQIAEELEKLWKSEKLDTKVNKKTVEQWEGGKFPKKDKLKSIACVLKIDIEVLTKAFDISKETRDLEKKARNPKKIIPKRSEEFF